MLRKKILVHCGHNLKSVKIFYRSKERRIWYFDCWDRLTQGFDWHHLVWQSQRESGKKWCPCLCHLTWKHSLGIKYHQKKFYLLKTPPSNEAFRHSGGESLLCTSATVTLYLDVELSNDKRPGTLQNTSEGTIPNIIFSWWLPLWWWWSRDRIPVKFIIF